MKKLLLSLAAIVALFATSCVTDSTDTVLGAGEKCTVTLAVSTDALGTRTESTINDGTKATKLSYAVYSSDWTFLFEGSATMDGLSATIPVQLVKNNTYNFVFWAQSPDATCYNVALNSSNPTISVSYEGAQANDDNRDAFFGRLDNYTVTGTINASVKLTRPFAQVNFATNDTDLAIKAGFDVANAVTKFTTEAYTTLSLKDGAVSNPTSVEFVATTNPTEALSLKGSSIAWDWMAMNYILVPESESSLSVCKMNINPEGANIEISVPMAPVKRNWRTNLVGKLLTQDGNIEIVVDPVFASEIAQDMEGNYYISDAAGLKWVANEVNKVAPQEPNIFDSKTVYLTQDIDMQGAEWTPIGDYAFSRTVFRGTFDGQGHTIKNFKVTALNSRTEKVAEASYGLFGNVSGTIKNLNIDNATVTPASSAKFVGALVGRLKEGALIDNCHVTNSIVTAENWQVGGLAGQANSAHIKNSSVANTTVTGMAAVGAIAGLFMTADEYTIENCAISNCALVQNGHFSNAELYDPMYGLVAGAIWVGGTTVNITNLTLSNNTIKGVASEVLFGDIEKGAQVYVDGELVAGYLPIEGADGIALDGDGNYVITAATGLDYIRTNLDSNDGFAGKTIILDSNITLSGEFAPLAAGSRSDNVANGTGFKGVFDGNGNTISGLSITNGGKDDAIGFFGIINGGEVKNVNFTNVAINATNCENAGTVAGLVVNGGKISDVTVSGSVVAKRGNGGIAGRILIEGTIENCTNNATVSGTGSNVAGIVGAAYYTKADCKMTIKGCTNNGTVTGAQGGVGGVAGLSCADIENCSNNGEIVANGGSVGGIVGEQSNAGSVIGCHNYANVTNANGASTGGIVGWTRYNGADSAYPVKEVIEISNNTNEGTISGLSFVGGIVGQIYNYALVENNTSNAPKIIATNTDALNGKAAGIVAYAYCAENVGVIAANFGIALNNNTSNTVAENILGADTDPIVNYDTTSPYITLSGNTPKVQQNTEIWYTSDMELVPTHADALDATIVSNVWDSKTGKGVITFNASLTIVGDRAFQRVTNSTPSNWATSISLPKSVTSIGNYAFAQCYSLTEIVIPDSVVSIGEYAFHSCNAVTKATIGSGVATIASSAFYDCYSLVELVCKPTTPPTVADKWAFYNAPISKVVVPSSAVADYKAANVWSNFNIVTE